MPVQCRHYRGCFSDRKIFSEPIYLDKGDNRKKKCCSGFIGGSIVLNLFVKLL